MYLRSEQVRKLRHMLRQSTAAGRGNHRCGSIVIVFAGERGWCVFLLGKLPCAARGGPASPVPGRDRKMTAEEKLRAVRQVGAPSHCPAGCRASVSMLCCVRRPSRGPGSAETPWLILRLCRLLAVRAGDRSPASRARVRWRRGGFVFAGANRAHHHRAGLAILRGPRTPTEERTALVARAGAGVPREALLGRAPSRRARREYRPHRCAVPPPLGPSSHPTHSRPRGPLADSSLVCTAAVRSRARQRLNAPRLQPDLAARWRIRWGRWLGGCGCADCSLGRWAAERRAEQQRRRRQQQQQQR